MFDFWWGCVEDCITTRSWCMFQNLVRDARIELASDAWEASILPLNESRTKFWTWEFKQRGTLFEHHASEWCPRSEYSSKAFSQSQNPAQWAGFISLEIVFLRLYGCLHDSGTHHDSCHDWIEKKNHPRKCGVFSARMPSSIPAGRTHKLVMNLFHMKFWQTRRLTIALIDLL